MSKFIGVKMVEAVPMTAGEAAKKGYRTPVAESAMDLYIAGYEVTYEDGYKSWCPKDVFEKNNRPVDGMTFGFAIESLKKKVLKLLEKVGMVKVCICGLNLLLLLNLIGVKTKCLKK